MAVPPYPARDIANWFISQAKAEEEEPSSQQLHRLIGRAQGHYLARYGRPLLAEPGNDDRFTRQGVDLATASFLGEVWDGYGGCLADVKLVIPAAR